MDGPLHKVPDSSMMSLILSQSVATINCQFIAKSFIGFSFVDTKTVEPDHVLLQSISATIWLIADGAEVFANNMLCLYMPECVCFLYVTVITLATKPNQFSHLPANRAHLRKHLHVYVCTNWRVTFLYLLLTKIHSHVQLNMPCLLFM